MRLHPTPDLQGPTDVVAVGASGKLLAMGAPTVGKGWAVITIDAVSGLISKPKVDFGVPGGVHVYQSGSSFLLPQPVGKGLFYVALSAQLGSPAFIYEIDADCAVQGMNATQKNCVLGKKPWPADPTAPIGPPDNLGVWAQAK